MVAPTRNLFAKDYLRIRKESSCEVAGRAALEEEDVVLN